ncbi:MAG: DNA alkylation repair protein [Ilumatobacteraceae bacterium]
MATLDVRELRSALTEVAVPADAGQMAAYMRHRSTYLGVKTPARRAASKGVFVDARSASATDLIDFADACWAEPEREFQYVGSDVLARNCERLLPGQIDDLRRLIATKAWWDTVDALASPTVGEMIRLHPQLLATMDAWVDDQDFWLGRTAILHQLRFEEATDADRLFAYCARRAGDTEFFVRKAIGWALRQYARTDPDAVRRFVAETELSGLSRREALKHLGA